LADAKLPQPGRQGNGDGACLTALGRHAAVPKRDTNFLGW
jgi:hypothetical protein